MPGSELANQFSFTKDFRHVAYRGAGANEYSEIYVGGTAGATPRQVTQVSDQLKGFDTGKTRGGALEVGRWGGG